MNFNLEVVNNALTAHKVMFVRCVRAMLSLTVALSIVYPASANDATQFDVGGHFELDLEGERNFDLDDSDDRDLWTVRPELQLEMRIAPDAAVNGYLQLELRREIALVEEGEKDSRDLELLVEEAYINLEPNQRPFSLRVGRQEFKDPREWLYDEDLDGIRLFYSHQRAAFELSASRQRLASRDLLNRDSRSRVNNYLLYVSYAVSDDVDVSGYWLYQDDLSSDNESPVFFGLRSSGRLAASLQHWLELAAVRGDDGSRDLRGYGADVGATWFPNHPLRPYFTLGYAIGSGDSDSAGTRDRAFRQTGFQDNDGRFGGVTSFRYYGEVLDPELSNLTIVTVGAGFRPTKRASIDLVYHWYRQIERSDELRDSALSTEPRGTSRQIGQEIDLIVGYREIKNLRLELMLGYFFPGNAFAPGADGALFTGFEARYRF